MNVKWTASSSGWAHGARRILGGVAGGCVVLLGTATIPASAQTGRLAASGGLVERLTDRVPTSGVLVAGIHVGSSEDRFSPDRLGLHLNSDLRGKSVCVRVATRDGRYRALGLYKVGSYTSTTPGLEFRSSHLSALETMPANVFAVRAVVATGCDDATAGSIVPATLSGAAPATRLVVLLNPGDANARIRLLSTDGAPLSGEPVRCRTVVGGPRIAFTQTCELDLSGAGLNARGVLEIVLVELTEGRSVHRFNIELPVR